MKHPLFSPEQTVAQAMDAARAIPSVFIKHRTACVGCILERFCTLQDVAKTYSLSLEAFLGELQQVALADASYVPGAEHEEPD